MIYLMELRVGDVAWCWRANKGGPESYTITDIRPYRVVATAGSDGKEEHLQVQITLANMPNIHAFRSEQECRDDRFAKLWEAL